MTSYHVGMLYGTSREVQGSGLDKLSCQYVVWYEQGGAGVWLRQAIMSVCCMVRAGRCRGQA